MTALLWLSWQWMWVAGGGSAGAGAAGAAVRSAGSHLLVFMGSQVASVVEMVAVVGGRQTLRLRAPRRLHHAPQGVHLALRRLQAPHRLVVVLAGKHVTWLNGMG